MMKIVFSLVLALLLASCGGDVVGEVKVNEGNVRQMTYQRVCIDGVVYLVGDRRMTGHFKADGSLYTCETIVGEDR